MDGKSIVNLSNIEFTEDQVKVLSKGLKFCPTPGPPDPGEQCEDLNKLHRRLRQIAFYEGIESSHSQISQNVAVNTGDIDNLQSTGVFRHRKFKIPATGRGPIGPPTLEAMIVCNEQDFNSRQTYKPPPLRQNLTLGERKDLRDLLNDNRIIFKPADKGQALVCLNRLDYLREGYKQLSDTAFYQKQEFDLTDTFKREISNFVEDMFQNGEIDETVKKYLLKDNNKTAKLYFLPKIHKGITPPPGRPVVAANGAPTERISQFVDHFVNPFCPQIKSYVKDTTHFLQKLQEVGELPRGSMLVTMDVVALYPNIPHQGALDAVKNMLHKHRPGPVRPSNDTLVKLLSMVLTKNNFTFNGKHFLQLIGTSIGTKAAPGVANHYLDWFERMFVYPYKLQPFIYVRYIDDCFLIWHHSLQELHKFVEHLNAKVPTIKFTVEISEMEVPFLDVKVKKINDKIVTDLYTKPTDSHDYLLYSSSHPQRCKDSIPFSQFLRLRRICSEDRDFDRHVIYFSTHFLRRGYPLTILQEAAVLARRKVRTELLKGHSDTEIKNTSPQEKVFLINTFHPSEHTLREIVHKNWNILGGHPTTEFLFDKKLVVGYRRPKNLRDLLVRAIIPFREGDQVADPESTQVTETEEYHDKPRVDSIDSPPEQEGRSKSMTKTLKQSSILDFVTKPVDTTQESSDKLEKQVSQTRITLGTGVRKGTDPSKRGFNFCNTTRCRYCPKLDKSGEIVSKTTGIRHECMKNISCRSSNLIYCITCKICNIQYMGQTSLRLKDRCVHDF
jgi:hypothetical protein